MHEQESEINQLCKEPLPVPCLRSLGATEHLLWLLDQKHPSHFAMVAEITGRTTLDAWCVALLAMQRKHPLLSARVCTDAKTGPCFHNVQNASIPLRVMGSRQSSWQIEVARELAAPFDYSRAPLIRTVLLHETDRVTLILVAHHAVADGMAASLIIGDILRALNGEHLTPLDVPKPMDHLLEKELRELLPQPASVPQGPVIAKAFRAPDASLPSINECSLTPALTASLAKRSRSEGTTVHGALGAAIYEAGRRLAPDWRGRPVQIVTPIDIRHLAREAATAVGLYTSRAVTFYEHRVGAPFWDLARATKRSIEPSQTREATLMHLKDLQAMTASKPTVQEVAGFGSTASAFDVILTNLGNNPIPLDYGSLQIQALWGPMTQTGLSREQTVGVCTTNGVLRLTHASYAPIRGLLDTVHEVLSAAVFDGTS